MARVFVTYLVSNVDTDFGVAHMIVYIKDGRDGARKIRMFSWKVVA